MKDPVKVEIVIEREDLEKMLELTGSESAFSEFLTKAIQRLYREHRIFGDDLSVEHIVSVAEYMTKQNIDYRELTGELQRRLKRLTMTQEELMATVDMFRN